MTSTPDATEAPSVPRYPYVHLDVPTDDVELVSYELWEQGAQGIEERELPIDVLTPVTDHAASDEGGTRILGEEGWPEPLIRAAISHAYGICTDLEPLSDMEKVLFAVDELTGLVAAAALVRPSRSVLDLEPSSVKKKWTNARFAAGVDRAHIERGAERLGLPLEALIAETIAGMRARAESLGLAGAVAHGG